MKVKRQVDQVADDFQDMINKLQRNEALSRETIAKMQKIQELMEEIGNHELAPYVENYQLRMIMDQGDTPALRGFFDRNDGTYVAEKLRADWIRWLGKRGNWAEIIVEYPKLTAPEPDVTCWSQQARLAG